MRESFIFYKSFFDSIEELAPEDQLILYSTICKYALDGIEPNIKGPARAVFICIKPQIDANTRRYENGLKGGRPSNKPKQNQNKTKLKRNENDNENVNENENDNDSGFQRFTFGSFNNVELTQNERDSLTDSFERSGELINKVSAWLCNARNPVPDHYALCLTFADNESWPKRRIIEPVEVPKVKDPLEPDEQKRKVAEMRARLNGAIKSV